MRICVFLVTILVSGAAQADCQWIDQPTADRALSMLRDSPSAVFGDRLKPGPGSRLEVGPIPRIGLVARDTTRSVSAGGPMYKLVVHEGGEIDIEQVYIPTADGAYVNLGRQVGCAGDSVAERLPGMPPVREADRSGVPVPAGSGGKFIGLVDLRSLYSDPEDSREPVPVHPVTLYSAPELSAPVHATVPDWDALPHDRMGYDFPAALVLERDKGWYRIGVVDGPMPPDGGEWALGWYDFSSAATAWVAPQDAGEFRSYEALVTNRLAYLGDRWDGLLSAAPDPAARIWSLEPEWRRSFFTPDEINVVVRETRWVGDRLWVHVAVLWPGECEGIPPLRIAEGWVPGHTVQGEPVVRYYSGGC